MSEKITFKELVNTISEKTGRSRRSTVDFIRNLTDVVETSLRNDGSATLAGFGKVELRRMKARKGVNPGTGEDLHVSTQNKVVFKPFKPLRVQVNSPYKHLESRLLTEEAEETSRNEGSSAKTSTGPQTHTQVPVDIKAPAEDEESVEELVYERPSPVGKNKSYR